MRVTLSQQVQSTLSQLNTASQKLSNLQTQASSGKRLLRPSDDVPATDRSITLRSAISNLQQLSDNTVVSKPLLSVTDSALSDICDALQSARDIAVAAGNASLTNEAREAYATQLDNILSQLEDTANTQYLGQYIFSGTATDDQAVIKDAVTGEYQYNGNDGVRRTQIMTGIVVPLNISGNEVFNFDEPAGSETTDMFTAIKQLKDKVLYGTVDDISGQLSNIDANIDNVLSCEARVGSWINRTDKAKNVIDDTSDRLKELLSDEEDIDLPQAIIDMTAQQNVYQAALAISSKVMDLSLASLKYA